jgi:hypothetical protein
LQGRLKYKPWSAAEAAIGMDLRQGGDSARRRPPRGAAQVLILAFLSFFSLVTNTEAMSAAKPAN